MAAAGKVGVAASRRRRPVSLEEESEYGLWDEAGGSRPSVRSKEVLALRRRQLEETRHTEPGTRPCQWAGCGRAMPSLEALVDHLHTAHLPAAPRMYRPPPARLCTQTHISLSMVRLTHDGGAADKGTHLRVAWV
jgi:hypothetical protein